MSNQSNEPDLTGLTCFRVTSHNWGARKKLQASDLHGVNENDLPAADLASLGANRLINPKRIAVFESLGKSMERYLSSIGIFVEDLGVFAVPDTLVPDASKKLDSIVAEHNKEKADFIVNYPTYRQEWIDTHPKWEHVTNKAPVDGQEVANKFHLSWRCFKVVAPVTDLSSPLNKGLTKTMGGLGGVLYAEIAGAARAMLKAVSSIGTWRDRTLSPLRQMRAKLDGLAFLDPGAHCLIGSIDHVLSIMPGKGPFAGPEVAQAFLLLNTLADEKRMQDHIQLVGKGASVSAIFAAPAPVVQPVAQQQTQVQSGSTPDQLQGGTSSGVQPVSTHVPVHVPVVATVAAVPAPVEAPVSFF